MSLDMHLVKVADMPTGIGNVHAFEEAFCLIMRSLTCYPTTTTRSSSTEEYSANAGTVEPCTPVLMQLIRSVLGMLVCLCRHCG